MKRYIIVGLRANHPTIIGTGYLLAATQAHRYGFQLPGNDHWWAFTSDPMLAANFESRQTAEQLAELLAKNDRGDFRPITIMEVYI